MTEFLKGREKEMNNYGKGKKIGKFDKEYFFILFISYLKKENRDLFSLKKESCKE